MEPITRKETLLSAVSDESDVALTPITREEQFLYALSHPDAVVPAPITREEIYLKAAVDYIKEHSATLVDKSIMENGEYDPADDNADGYSLVTVAVPAPVSKLPKVVDKSITTITAEDLAGATSIGAYTFKSCGSLSSIDFPNSITSIGAWAFHECRALTSIVIPNTVTSIGSAAFYTCNGLRRFIILATEPPTLDNSNALDGTSNCPIYVQTPDDYKVETNWASFANRFFPLVATVSGLANIDTTTYTKACVIGADESYKEYTYDGSQWNEVT